MVRDDIALKFQERISYELRALYRRWGYAPYRVGKFEEYELYARNRSFLLSDRILSFTDTDGVKVNGEFLDIVCRDGIEYAVISPDDADGYVDIFRIQILNGDERYIREKDDKVLDEVFEIFRIKNEDEFDFD